MQNQKWKRTKPVEGNRLQRFLDVLTQAKDAIEKQKAVYEDELEFLEGVSKDLAEKQNA